MTNSSDSPCIRVDRGQPVIVTVTFGDGDPDEIFFTYMAPGEERPRVDDGYGQPRSAIERVAEGVYRYSFSTKGFEAGEGTWHFFGEWKEKHKLGYDEASIYGKFVVNDAPKQLL